MKKKFNNIIIIATMVITLTCTFILKLMTLGHRTILYTIIPIIPSTFILYILYIVDYLFYDNKKCSRYLVIYNM